MPGDGFNLDHVVISTHGIYAIETTTWSKPWPNAQVVVEGDALKVASDTSADLFRRHMQIEAQLWGF